MHMLDMWHEASQVYKNIKLKNKNVQVVCPCLVDEQDNGIIKYLTNLSERFQNWIPPPIDGERKWPTRNRKGRAHIVSYKVKPYR